MAEGRFNTVLILDAIHAGELNTASRMREQMRDICNYHIERLHVLGRDPVAAIARRLGSWPARACDSQGVADLFTAQSGTRLPVDAFAQRGLRRCFTGKS